MRCIMSWRKNFYNKRSAKKLGWQPSWFGTTGFNTELIAKIMAFQEDHDLEADGMCGDMTYRRKIATDLKKGLFGIKSRLLGFQTTATKPTQNTENLQWL